MSSSVKLRVLVEIYAPGSYGEEWRIKDMFEQTAKEGIQALENLLKDKGRIIGEPELVAVMVPREKR
jgi:hypothetical protein